ncbi:single-stranded DNA-bindig protein WHY2, mitochondrial isoform X2 [Ananas comosus]|uniref:Single-stranded DNA-bindig protein WHY2, mitochondrial isoform X2 n=1 Tax=Ananas comosus TaxID=4615 RepID=A0A6P5GG03_ANACO|nr:single-stranded DNA-bindig protein WHY2, mitochondrial isoform X2 [Ananas comosus]
MTKLARFLPSRNLLLRCSFNIKDAFWINSFSSHRGISSSAADYVTDGSSGRSYANYTVFKGKAALSMSPLLPKFRKLESGASKVEKNGVVLLTFWPAIGQRKYDWQKKQIFALSPTELGSLISLGPAEHCEFLHDPSMKSSLEGQVKKSLSITPLGNDSGYFVNLLCIAASHGVGPSCQATPSKHTGESSEAAGGGASQP